MSFYELALLGRVEDELTQKICAEIKARVHELGLDLGDQVSLHVGPASEFHPSESRCAAALCLSPEAADEHSLKQLMRRRIPLIPVASSKRSFDTELPGFLRELNGLAVDEVGPSGLVLALLECASLLPRQRRVFISYRRSESTEAALQLYAALSARLFDVFLDTHDIQPGKHFQEVLWQRLCDCDVILHLDTPTYFDSRWTDAEFGRAIFRGIPFVRAVWPGVAFNDRAQLSESIALDATDFTAAIPGHLTDSTIKKICDAVEGARTTSVAQRFEQLMEVVQSSIKRARGTIEGVSLRRSLLVRMPNNKTIAIYPSLGVPTSFTLHDATRDQHPPPVAVVYDDAGIDETEWHAHMDWISSHLRGVVRLIKGYRAGYDFADWN